VGLLFAFPFYFIRAAIAGLAIYRLLRVVLRGTRGGMDIALTVFGLALALVGFSPLLMFGWRMLSMD